MDKSKFELVWRKKTQLNSGKLFRKLLLQPRWSSCQEIIWKFKTLICYWFSSVIVPNFLCCIIHSFSSFRWWKLYELKTMICDFSNSGCESFYQPFYQPIHKHTPTDTTYSICSLCLLTCKTLKTEVNIDSIFWACSSVG